MDRLKAAASSFALTQLPFSPPVDDDDGPPSRSPQADLGVIGPPSSPALPATGPVLPGAVVLVPAHVLDLPADHGP